jgi:hypothetical protein
VLKDGHRFLLSAPEQSDGQLAIGRKGLVPSPWLAEERKMLRATQSAANRLTAEEASERTGRSREKS